jgi:hypothetical protein
MIELDHILWASPDLDQGVATLSALTGVAPAPGGSHPGFGTRNSLLSLGATYLEIIAPDPKQQLVGNWGAAIAALPQPGLSTFAVRTTDLAAYMSAAERAGLAVEGPVAMSRTRPDGLRLAWACAYPRHPSYGEAVPFAIDWRGSPHPAASAPSGCRLLDFAVLHPEPEPLAALYRVLGVAVAVRRAARPGLTATLATPRGEVLLLGP